MNKKMLFERLKRELDCTFQYPELKDIIRDSKVYSKRNKEYSYYDSKKNEVSTSFEYEFTESEYKEIKLATIKYLAKQGKLVYRNDLAKELNVIPKRLTDFAVIRNIHRIVVGGGRGKKMYFTKAQAKEIREYFENEYNPRKDESENKDLKNLIYILEKEKLELLKDKAELIKENAELRSDNNWLRDTIQRKEKTISDLQNKKKKGFFGRLFGHEK